MKIISSPKHDDHQKAVEWAREVLSDPSSVVLDTETTDLDGWVCELTIVDVETRYPVIDRVLNPGVPISDGAYRIHGISDLETAGAYTFGDVLPGIIRVLTEDRIVCWNAPFDFGMINKELARVSCVSLKDNWQCAMRMYGQWKGELSDYGTYKWHKLEGGHRALGDCLAVIDRLNEMAQG